MNEENSLFNYSLTNMKTVTQQLEKEISKLDKLYDAAMKKFNQSLTINSQWGDANLFRAATNIANKRQLLINALDLINKYKTN